MIKRRRCRYSPQAAIRHGTAKWRRSARVKLGAVAAVLGQLAEGCPLVNGVELGDVPVNPGKTARAAEHFVPGLDLEFQQLLLIDLATPVLMEVHPKWSPYRNLLTAALVTL